MKASEIYKNQLWSGPVNATDSDTMSKLIDKGLECVVSILPIGHIGNFAVDSIKPVPKAHRILFCWDDDVVEPERIYLAIKLYVPTLIHCNSGKNRSTALAACWLCTHILNSPEQALERVIAARTKDLGQKPKVTDAMRKNVENYAEWLSSIKF